MREGRQRRPHVRRGGWRAGAEAAGTAPRHKSRSRGPDAPMNPPDGGGGIRIEDAVVAKIVAIAARDVDEIRVRDVAARGPSRGPSVGARRATWSPP